MEKKKNEKYWNYLQSRKQRGDLSQEQIRWGWNENSIVLRLSAGVMSNRHKQIMGVGRQLESQMG